MSDKKFRLFAEITVQNKLPCNLLDKDFQLFARAVTEKIPASYYWQLVDCLLLKDTVFRKFKFWEKYSYTSGLGNKSKFNRLLLFLFKKREIDKGVWITDNWSNSYFHWFTDALTKLEAVSPFLNGHLVLLPESYKSFGFIHQSLEILNCPYIFLKDRVPNKIKNFVLPSATALTGNFNPHIINSLRKRFQSGEKLITPFRKVFISRRNAKSRRLLNEEELLKRLQEFNFEIHLFEEYSLEQQIKIMNECMILIGVHGAALTNMLFMQLGTSVLELRKNDDCHNNCYFSMASALNINYYYSNCRANNSSTQTSDFEILENEIHNLNSTLSEILKIS